MKVWKYALPAPQDQLSKISMPQGAHVIGLMYDSVLVAVNPDAPVTDYSFLVVRTDEDFQGEVGWPHNTYNKYVGTYMRKEKIDTKETHRAYHVFQCIKSAE